MKTKYRGHYNSYISNRWGHILQKNLLSYICHFIVKEINYHSLIVDFLNLAPY